MMNEQKNTRLLFLDSDLYVTQALIQRVGELGVPIAVASCTETALERLASMRGNIRLILVDLSASSREGFISAWGIRLRPEYALIPMVGVADRRSYRVDAQARVLHIGEILYRPFEPGRLRSLLKAYGVLAR